MTASDSLPAAGFLQLLDETSRARIAGVSRRIHFERGDTVLEQGDYVDCLYVVESGLLRAEVPDRHGLPFEVARFGPGEYCGEMSFLRGERASATIRVATATDLFVIPHAILGDVSEHHPALMRELAGVVASRLSATNDRFRQLRPGRLLGCVSDRSGLSATFVRAVAQSAAEHLQGPVLMIDLGNCLTGDGTQALSDLECALSDPALLGEHDRFAGQPRPYVGLVPRREAGAIDIGRLLKLLSEYQSRYRLVLVHAVANSASDVSILNDFEGPLIVREAHAGIVADWSAPAKKGAETVLLADHPVVGVGADAIRVIETDLPRLMSARSGDVEPGRSIGWVARHVLRRNVGIALGAGGAKGYAHLGVMAELAKGGIFPDFLAGSSIGAPVAAAVASQMPLDELRRLLDRTFAKALRFTIPVQSFLSGRVLRKELEQIAKGRTFEDLPLPLAIVAVDLWRHSEVVFRSGDVATAMVASMAIPGIFPPVRWQGRQLVDGGVLNPIPNATVAASGADIVIGVKLSNPALGAEPPTRRRPFALRAPPIVDTIQAAFDIMQCKIIEDGAARADVTIEPRFQGTVGLRDFGHADEFIRAGREAVHASLAEIRALLPWAK